MVTEKAEGKSGWGERLAAGIGLKPHQANLAKLVVIGVAVGVLFLNAGDLFGLGQEPVQPLGATEVHGTDVRLSDQLELLERELALKLERTLSIVEGAGKVLRVTVTLESGPRSVPVLNTRQQETTTDEKAGDNSTRKSITTQKDETNVVTRDGSRDTLAVLRTSRAQIAGVLIVADGAKSVVVRARLHEAAVTALGIPAHRITVVPAGGR